MHSPLLGQFATRDPLGYVAGDMNVYRYCANDPTNAVDPSGLQWSHFVRYKQLNWDDDFQPSSTLDRYLAMVSVAISVAGNTPPETISDIQFEKPDRTVCLTPKEAREIARLFISQEVHLMSPGRVVPSTFIINRGPPKARCSLMAVKFDSTSVDDHVYACLDRNKSVLADWLHTQWDDRNDLQRTLAAYQNRLTTLEDQLVKMIRKNITNPNVPRDELLKFKRAMAVKEMQAAIATQKSDIAFLSNFFPNMNRLLNHEQRHLDIAELYARAFAAELKSLRVVVAFDPKADAVTIDGYEKEAQEALVKFAQSRVGVFERGQVTLNTSVYDRNVDHGLIVDGPNGQTAWDQWIIKELAISPGENPNSLNLDKHP